MSQRRTHRNEAAASELALTVAANGGIDPREMQVLDALQAFERLGIRRERFLELARGCLDDVGSTLTHLPTTSWGSRCTSRYRLTR